VNEYTSFTASGAQPIAHRGLVEGLARMLDYYREHMPHDVPTAASRVGAL
jgi:hypothetical protein